MRKTAAIIGVATLALTLGACGSSDDAGGAEAAQAECEDQVKEKFKTPSTAKFFDVEVDERDEATHIIEGSASAENGFGATVDHEFRCVMRQTASGWDANITLEER